MCPDNWPLQNQVAVRYEIHCCMAFIYGIGFEIDKMFLVYKFIFQQVTLLVMVFFYNGMIYFITFR